MLLAVALGLMGLLAGFHTPGVRGPGVPAAAGTSGPAAAAAGPDDRYDRGVLSYPANVESTFALPAGGGDEAATLEAAPTGDALRLAIDCPDGSAGLTGQTRLVVTVRAGVGTCLVRVSDLSKRRTSIPFQLRVDHLDRLVASR